MASQKLRLPNTVSDAVTCIIAFMGVERVAHLLNKRPAIVYAWSDPDDEREPTYGDMLAMDAAFVAAGHGEAPIARAYRAQLERIADAPDHKVGDPFKAFCDLAREFTEAGGTYREAMTAVRPTPDACKRALRELSELIDQAERMSLDIASVMDQQSGATLKAVS